MFDNNNQPRGLIFDLILKIDYLKSTVCFCSVCDTEVCSYKYEYFIRTSVS